MPIFQRAAADGESIQHEQCDRGSVNAPRRGGMILSRLYQVERWLSYQVEMLNRTNRSSTDENFKVPPDSDSVIASAQAQLPASHSYSCMLSCANVCKEIYPWSEFPNTIAWTFDELKRQHI